MVRIVYNIILKVCRSAGLFLFLYKEFRVKVRIHCYTQQVFADQITPIGIYLNVRDLFPGSILLESSEVDDKTNSRSIIAANPIAGFQLKGDKLITYGSEGRVVKPASAIGRIQDELKEFVEHFEVENPYEGINGFFGFQSFEAVHYFETKNANVCPQADPEVALIDYRLYQYVISINHFNGEVIFIENTTSALAENTVRDFATKVLTRRSGTYPFSIASDEAAHCTNEEYMDMVRQAQQHCQWGDVFQMVLSRRFKRAYRGDEFNVYRALRHVNPSPYMFYFDYGAYKIFGSSPEAQIRVMEGEATINPIAGTYKRTGDKLEDERLGNALLADQKELAEHAMLVDLARNDLNRHCNEVEVAEYKAIHQYSHVIHMVSTVKGELENKRNNIEVLADTFPAGTLSGAPKVRALQLLADLENDPRSFYGGSIGFIDFKGDINQAIIIRSFMAKDNKIHYRAGAGIVLHSDPESELQEVDNKLGALRKALQEAENL